MNHRTEQVAAVIQMSVQNELTRGLQDPRVRGLMTVTRVKVSDDLADASVFVSIHPPEHAELTMHGIRHAGRYLQRKVRSRLPIRRMPRLTFQLDRSIQRASETYAALQDIARENQVATDGDHASVAQQETGL